MYVVVPVQLHKNPLESNSQRVPGLYSWKEYLAWLQRPSQPVWNHMNKIWKSNQIVRALSSNVLLCFLRSTYLLPLCATWYMVWNKFSGFRITEILISCFVWTSFFSCILFCASTHASINIREWKKLWLALCPWCSLDHQVVLSILHPSYHWFLLMELLVPS